MRLVPILRWTAWKAGTWMTISTGDCTAEPGVAHRPGPHSCFAQHSAMADGCFTAFKETVAAMSELDYDDPDVEERWCFEQQKIVADYLRSQKVRHGQIGDWPA